MAGPKKISQEPKQTGESQIPQAIPEPHPNWQHFAEAFSGHPALKEDAIYALPRTLVKAIRIEIPQFFTREDQAFEETLRNLSGEGFFLKTRLGYRFHQSPLSRGEKSDIELKEDGDKELEVGDQIKIMLAQEMIDAGRTDAEIRHYFKRREEFKLRLQGRRMAYAGWLMTNPGFRREREAFCEKWSERIRELQQIPTVPLSLMGGSPRAIAR